MRAAIASTLPLCVSRRFVTDLIANDVVDCFHPRAHLGIRYGRAKPELRGLSVWIDRFIYDRLRLCTLHLQARVMQIAGACGDKVV